MDNNLRKVIFSIGNYEFHPDSTPAQQAEMEARAKQREGFFHRWVDKVDTSRDIPCVKTLALVEDIEDGKMHRIEEHNLTFIED